MKRPFPAVQRGDKDPAVAVLQTVLLTLGCNSPNIKVDGDFGEQTELGLRQLQEGEMDIEPTGIIDEDFFEAFADYSGFDLREVDLDAFQFLPAAREQT